MGQFGKVLLAVNNAHTVRQRSLDCGPGLAHAAFVARFPMNHESVQVK